MKKEKTEQHGQALAKRTFRLMKKAEKEKEERAHCKLVAREVISWKETTSTD